MSNENPASKQVYDRILTFIRERLLTPLPEGPIHHEVLYGPFDLAYPTLVQMGQENPDAVRLLAARHDFGAADSHSRGYELGKLLVRVLAAVDSAGDCICALALDDAAPWYVRVSAIEQLQTRDEDRLLRPLLDLATGKACLREIRLAALAATMKLPDALSIFRSLSTPEPGADDKERAFQKELIKARGRLGDQSVLRDLFQFHATEALETLLASFGGLPAILTALQVPNPDPMSNLHLVNIERLMWLVRNEERPLKLWALELLPKEMEVWREESRKETREGKGELVSLDKAQEAVENFILDCLGDSDWPVAFTAARQLLWETGTYVSGERFAEIVPDSSAPRGKRLWALYSLLCVKDEYPNIDISAIAKTIPGLRVPDPENLPPLVRKFIINHEKSLAASDGYYAPGADVRWMIEVMQAEPLETVDYKKLLLDLLAALEASGIPHAKPENYERVVSEGDSPWNVRVEGCELSFSSIGPFVTIESESAPGELIGRCRIAAVSAGWEWLEPPQLHVRFEGIRGDGELEYPGSELVGSLLYFWVDFGRM